jgi:manganese transport protein
MNSGEMMANDELTYGSDKPVRGLFGFNSMDAEALKRERDILKQLQQRSVLSRWRGYFSLTGPGWIQSALTLGSGSALASIFAGVTGQYALLWVQPLAMLLGLIMLDVISHQTLATGQRPGCHICQ